MRVSVEVSVRNSLCEGAPLRAQLHWVAERFSKVTISVGDALNRHNYVVLGHPEEGKVTPDEATSISVEEGDAWLTANGPILEEELRGIPFRICRWGDWLGDSEFEGNLDTFRELYRTDPPFRRAIVGDVTEYTNRRYPDETLTPSDLDTLALHPLEELAVYVCQLQEGPLLIQYPGSMPHADSLLNSHEVVSDLLHDLYYRYLEFRQS